MFDVQDFLNSHSSFISAGLFVSDGEWIHPTRIIDSYELIFVVKGTLYIEEGGSSYTLSENESIFLRPNIKHAGTKVTRDKVSFYWVHFIFSDSFPSVKYSQNTYISSNSNLKILFKQLLHYSNTPEYPKECSDSLLRLIIIEVLLNKSISDSGNSVIKEIKEWIRINYDKNITMEDIELEFGYNKDYITRLFKKYYNTGIKKYINTVKMNKAKEFILSGAYPLKAIPQLLGIKDYNSFLKMFKYHEGVTPRQFRETYINIHINKK